MKIPAFAAALFVAVQLIGATTPVTSVVIDPTTGKAAEAPLPVPGKPVLKPKPVKEKEPVILGTVIARPNGTFLGVEVLGGQLKVSFFDKKKKPMALDVARGLARWQNPRGLGQIICPLNPGPTALLGTKPVLPPFSYTININLLQGEGENAKTVETYAVPFRG